MSYFRINLYLPIKYFFLSFFISKKNLIQKINKKLELLTEKKKIILTSQLRVGFILVLKYLKQKYPKKRQIIINSYNLAEMVNICKKLDLKIIYPELNRNLFFSQNDLKKKINKNTLAVVSTNIFNTFEDSLKVKKICKEKKIPLIEDNAIYFGNFKNKNKKRIYAGSFGDYSLISFNIMKNISAMYGGAVATNDKNFYLFANEFLKKFGNFPYIKYIKQCLTYLILKIFSIKIIYKYTFFKCLQKAHLSKNLFILSIVYPSLKFKKQALPKFYSTKINNLSIKMIYLQLNDIKNFNKNHLAKKNNNLYYQKIFSEEKIDGILLLKYVDANFQNFNDFPIVVKKKNELVNFLFLKGIETKTVQYVDCQKIFKSAINEKSKNYEDQILCLPNHRLISKKYIEYIVACLKDFYEKK